MKNSGDMAHSLMQEATFETLYTFPIESHWHTSVYFQTVWPKVTRDYVNARARGWTTFYFTVLKTETRCHKFVHPLRGSFNETDSLYLKEHTNSSSLKKEEAGSPETLVAIQHTTYSHIQDDCSMDS